MIERNIKKLLLERLEETGDDPNDVQCIYSIGFPLHVGVEGELSVLSCYSEKHRYKLVRKEPQIETSVRKARRDAPRN